MNKVIIIGAGASGIIAALKTVEKNEVILLEKNERIGKKILVTGNGRCNLWNYNLIDSAIANYNDYYYTDNYDLLNNIIIKYKDKVYEYLNENLNIHTVNENGYIYPYSKTASSVLTSLERKVLSNKNIKVITNFEVTELKKINNKYHVLSHNDKVIGDKVIIACGGLSSKLGTSTLNNVLSNELVTPYLPSLVPLKSDATFLNAWDGVRTKVKLSLLCDNEVIKEETGEIQLTNYGISGIVTFNLSGYASRLLSNNKKVYVLIDFLPDVDGQDLLFSLDKDNSDTIEEALETYFNYKLLFTILNVSNLNKDDDWHKLKLEDKLKLINNIKKFNLNIIDTLDFDRSQVSTGGVNLNNVNSNLSLKSDNNIYVIGEALNVDGICGGYNLAFAFISGYLVGCDLNDLS